jgi:hypothetical protein
LKNALAADGFCLQPFFATESAFLAVLFTFNLRRLYQHQTTPNQPYRQPGTLRTAVFLAGAVLGKMGREVGLKLSAAGGVGQAQAVGGSGAGLAENHFAEVGPTAGPAGHRRRFHRNDGAPVSIKNTGLLRNSG